MYLAAQPCHCEERSDEAIQENIVRINSGFSPLDCHACTLRSLARNDESRAKQKIANKHPIVKEWAVGPPDAVDLEPMITRRGKYRPIRELEYGNGYPILEGYRDSAALGWHAVWVNRLGESSPEGVPFLWSAPDLATVAARLTAGKA